ncbi:MAG: hypothetical protein H6557_13205 [Lewinellaceae bacterium]|nr:hypothetical protein [Phaeodactylibacter sp.]MCB9037565.1 hypothetical protein [Lewinellaceae bacterium]
MPKKKPKKGKPEVHDDLKGFDIKINEFGEIITNFDVDKVNEFLNDKVDDKKLRDREGAEGRQSGAQEEEE